MPSPLFESLPIEKKGKIIKAAIKEFSSCNYEQASINSIIKNADISRGSFYQYFHDKEEIYLYVLKSSFNKAFLLFEPIIKNEKLSFLEKIMCIFENVISYGEEAQLLSQVILNMKYNHHKLLIDEIAQIVEYNNLSIGMEHLNKLERKAFFDMLLSNFGIACFSVLIDKTPYQEVKELLECKLNIIKGGIK